MPNAAGFATPGHPTRIAEKPVKQQLRGVLSQGRLGQVSGAVQASVWRNGSRRAVSELLGAGGNPATTTPLLVQLLGSFLARPGGIVWGCLTILDKPL